MFNKLKHFISDVFTDKKIFIKPFQEEKKHYFIVKLQETKWLILTFGKTRRIYYNYFIEIQNKLSVCK